MGLPEKPSLLSIIRSSFSLIVILEGLNLICFSIFLCWKSRLNKFILSRDRFGEKPLYILKRFNEIYFSSEIKQIFALQNTKEKINFEEEYVFKKLAELEKYLSEKDEFSSLEILKELVPEWKRSQRI